MDGRYKDRHKPDGKLGTEKGGGPGKRKNYETGGRSKIDPHMVMGKRNSVIGNFKWEGHKDREDIRDLFGESIQYWGRSTPVSVDELNERIVNYFTDCYEKQQIPTIEDLALACGTNLMGFDQWIAGRRGKEFSDMCTQAKAMVQASDAKLAAANKIPQSVYIFRAKNFYGMRDQVDYTVKPLPIADTYDVDDIRSRYIAEIPIDGEYKDVSDSPEEKPQKAAERRFLS